MVIVVVIIMCSIVVAVMRAIGIIVGSNRYSFCLRNQCGIALYVVRFREVFFHFLVTFQETEIKGVGHVHVQECMLVFMFLHNVQGFVEKGRILSLLALSRAFEQGVPPKGQVIARLGMHVRPLASPPRQVDIPKPSMIRILHVKPMIDQMRMLLIHVVRMQLPDPFFVGGRRVRIDIFHEVIANFHHAQHFCFAFDIVEEI
mmetsp:Transcript_9898/g.14465  ORF Transcript_9898/g.14465 Transcript_9898/m.14465 type:complete len:202 (+) Transcript_9898:1313-1918(+)